MCVWQDFAELVPSVPQDEIQKRKDNEWEEPERHAEVVHLRTAKPLKEDGSEEDLNEAREAARNGERVANLGSLELITD